MIVLVVLVIVLVLSRHVAYQCNEGYKWEERDGAPKTGTRFGKVSRQHAAGTTRKEGSTEPRVSSQGRTPTRTPTRRVKRKAGSGSSSSGGKKQRTSANGSEEVADPQLTAKKLVKGLGRIL